jgi:hypothetical protein
MHVAHKQKGVPAATERLIKKPTKKQLYHEQMQASLRRRQYQDFESALRDHEIIELLKRVHEVSPRWQPKFRG